MQPAETMKRINRARSYHVTDNLSYRFLSMIDNDPYEEEGWSYHYPKGGRRKHKYLSCFQYRMYRTWKHNRKTKYKVKGD